MSKDQVKKDSELEALEEDFDKVPSLRQVCPGCGGNGTELYGSLKGADVTEMLREDPDMGEAYFGGAYDVDCSTCGGLRVVDSIDFERLTDEQKERLEEIRQYERETAWERRMIAAGHQF